MGLVSLGYLSPTEENAMQIIFESRDAVGKPMRELSVERVRGPTLRLALDHSNE